MNESRVELVSTIATLLLKDKKHHGRDGMIANQEITEAVRDARKIVAEAERPYMKEELL